MTKNDLNTLIENDLKRFQPLRIRGQEIIEVLWLFVPTEPINSLVTTINKSNLSLTISLYGIPIIIEVGIVKASNATINRNAILIAYSVNKFTNKTTEYLRCEFDSMTNIEVEGNWYRINEDFKYAYWYSLIKKIKQLYVTEDLEISFLKLSDIKQ